MSQRLNHLNSIISTLKTGANYYRKAARMMDTPEHETMFLEHAELRDDFARRLADMVEDAGGEVKETNVTEKGHEITGRIGAFIGDTEKTLIDSLEEHEDRTLETFRTVIHHPDSARDEQLLREMMASLQQTHDRMRELKRAS